MAGGGRIRAPKIVGTLARARIPNTRGGAALVALAVAALGFGVGVFLLVVLPIIRGGQGPFGLLRRTGTVVDTRDARSRQPFQVQPFPTPPNDRPELWLTPVATEAFPSDEQFAELSSGTGITYDPTATRKVFALAPIADAQGRPLIVPVVSLGIDDDVATPAVLRPTTTEPTELTVAVTSARSPTPTQCSFRIVAGRLSASHGVGSATVTDCQAGIMRLPDGSIVSFAIEYAALPNYRSRDGAWREGGVFGKTSVRLALTGAAPA